MGVFPYGAQVLTTLGIIRKPDSSAKTMWAPSLVAFFYTRPLFLFPALDLFFVVLQSASFGLLRSPTKVMHQATDVIWAIAHAKLALDQRGNACGGPQISAKPCTSGPLSSRRTSFFRCVVASCSGRPGEERTCNASSPPCRRASRQHITELALHPIRRPTSLSE